MERWTLRTQQPCVHAHETRTQWGGWDLWHRRCERKSSLCGRISLSDPDYVGQKKNTRVARQRLSFSIGETQTLTFNTAAGAALTGNSPFHRTWPRIPGWPRWVDPVVATTTTNYAAWHRWLGWLTPGTGLRGRERWGEMISYSRITLWDDSVYSMILNGLIIMCLAAVCQQSHWHTCTWKLT